MGRMVCVDWNDIAVMIDNVWLWRRESRINFTNIYLHLKWSSNMSTLNGVHFPCELKKNPSYCKILSINSTLTCATIPVLTSVYILLFLHRYPNRPGIVSIPYLFVAKFNLNFAQFTFKWWFGYGRQNITLFLAFI